MLLKIKSFFVALIVALGSISLLFRPAVPPAISIDELRNVPGIIDPAAPTQRIYVIEEGMISSAEFNTVICLQGLVNREKAQLYILNGGSYRTYFNELTKDAEVIRTDSEGNKWTLPLLIREFRSYITDSGYVLYRNSNFAEGLNTACNYSTAEGWLAVPEELKDMAEGCGLVLKKDISKENYSYAFLEKFFDEYKDSFRKNAVVHVKTAQQGLRDLAIQQKFPIIYSGEDAAGRAYLKKVLKWTGGNSYILGWGETEKHFVKFVSGLGCAVIPSDHSRNNSFLASYTFDIPEQTGRGEALTADPSKHYAAIVFSDGDNSQWIQNGFSEYYRKIQSYDTFPMTWTYPLIQQEISPICSYLAYNAAGENNCFAAGISGSGYMNPSHFDVDCLDKYTTETAAMMLKSNIDIVTILEDKPSLINTAAYEQNFEYFSRFDNIRGGIVMQDPERYASGHGKVWFTNDKPFVSVRLSLWYPDGEGSTVPKEWIEEQAAAVNSFAADPSSVNGYSVINVHPWTISVENLAYFVSLLDDGVELVTADQLIDLISQNVEHTNAVPNE